MLIIEIPKGNHKEKGSWYFLRHDKGRTLIMVCPMCKNNGALIGGDSPHTVDKQGIVSEVVVCVCGFPAKIQLVQYTRA